MYFSLVNKRLCSLVFLHVMNDLPPSVILTHLHGFHAKTIQAPSAAVVSLESPLSQSTQARMAQWVPAMGMEGQGNHARCFLSRSPPPPPESRRPVLVFQPVAPSRAVLPREGGSIEIKLGELSQPGLSRRIVGAKRRNFLGEKK